MAAATKKEKKKLTLGRPGLVAGTLQTLSNLFLETFDIYSNYSCVVRFAAMGDNQLSDFTSFFYNYVPREFIHNNETKWFENINDC
jgi:hypothetical protein